MDASATGNVVAYDTGTLPTLARARFWREAVCSTFVSVDCKISDVESFSGTIATRSLAGFTISRVRSGRHDVSRVPHQRAVDAAGRLLISYQRSGTSAVVQDGRTAVLNPGQFALYDTSRLYELHLGAACEQIVVSLPPAIAETRFGQTRALVARTVGDDRCLGPIAGAMFRRLGRLERHPSLLAEQHLCDAAGSIIAANLSALIDTLPDPQRSGRLQILLRSKAFIEQKLGLLDLSSPEIARASGVSVRYLQEIFQADQTTLRSYLWSRRLQRARRMLNDSAWRGNSISEIALACGFKDFSHFSRRFHEEFGTSARAFRKDHLAGVVE